MRFLFFVFVFSLFSVNVHAEIVSRFIEYEHSGEMLQGYLSYDDATREKRPGILVVHEWWGLNEFAKKKAEEVAALGYVAFAADMYGKGKVTDDLNVAGQYAHRLKGDPALMRSRAQVSLEVLTNNELVDKERTGAIGFCFGGTTVLELAYSGADLRGVATFHGGLTVPNPEDKITSSILVLHGAKDPYVSKEVIGEFEKEMKERGVDWQMKLYGNAVHSFTNPEANSEGAAYDEKAAKRSWREMKHFFEELFA